MFETLRFKLRSFKREPFSFIETLNAKESDYRYELTVIEGNRVLHYGIEYYEDIFDIVDKVCKEPTVFGVIVTDYDNKIHYYKELHND